MSYTLSYILRIVSFRLKLEVCAWCRPILVFALPTMCDTDGQSCFYYASKSWGTCLGCGISSRVLKRGSCAGKCAACMAETLSQANRWPPCQCQPNKEDLNDALELRTQWRLHRGELTAANDDEVIISGAASSSPPTATDHRTEPERRVRFTDAASSTTIEPSNQSHHATSQELQDLHGTIANLQAELMKMTTETAGLRAEVRRLNDFTTDLHTTMHSLQSDMDYRMEWEDFQW